ncbi:MAG TPA: hypothetical protein VIG80_14340 [Bacillaceae bacterium]
MKRFAGLMLVIFIVLTGCGNKVHKNIGQEMADDTEQIISIFEKNIKDNSDLSERDKKVFEEYKIKYGAMSKEPDSSSLKLTEEENRLYILTRNMIDMYDFYTTLKSDHEKFDNMKESIRTVIKTGEI